MKKLDKYILEKLKIDKDLKFKSVHPKNKRELRIIIEDRLKKSDIIDLSDIDISDVENLNNLFFGINPKIVDISYWDTSHIKDFSGMFKECTKLKSIYGIENLDMRNAVTLKNMFLKCESLEKLDLEKWRFENLEDITGLFFGCLKLTDVGDISSWDTSKLKERRYIFTNSKIQRRPSWFSKF